MTFAICAVKKKEAGAIWRTLILLQACKLWLLRRGCRSDGSFIGAGQPFPLKGSLFSATDWLWQEFSASPLAADVKWLNWQGRNLIGLR